MRGRGGGGGEGGDLAAIMLIGTIKCRKSLVTKHLGFLHHQRKCHAMSNRLSST